MIRIILLAFLLASCGGDDGGGSSSSGVMSFIGADPYIVDATFFYDQNDNGIFDEGELVSGPTDSNGNGTFPSIIPAGGKIVQLTGGVMDGFNYSGRLKGISNGSGGIVLSPLTTLSANGFTNEEVVALLNSVGIVITSDQVNQNPMTDPTLLRAALTISQGLSESLKSYDLSPSDITLQGSRAIFNDSYTQQIFEQASKVYGQVITEDEFNSDLPNLSKVVSSFFNYINPYGASDFATSTEIDEAKSALYSVVGESTNPFEPVTLEKRPISFGSRVLKNDWFKDGNYDLIGINFSNIYTRSINNTIGNYPFSPMGLEFILAPASIGNKKMTMTSDPTRQESWTVDSDSGMVNYSGSYNPPDLSRSEKVQVVNDLPISTYSRSNNLLLRSTVFYPQASSINEQGLRLIGEGQGIYTYYGVNWGENPTDPQYWVADKSRTNNCILGNQPTTNCQDPGVTYFYDSQKENSTERSFSALTESSDLGNPSGALLEMKFVLKITPLGATTTTEPKEYSVSEIILEPANLIEVGCPNDSNKRCIAVKVPGEINPRPALENSSIISFWVGYKPGSFPEDYKVYAINEIKIKTTETSGKFCTTKNSSSFFKANMLVIKMDCDTDFPEAQYLMLDLTSKRGVVGSYLHDWKEGSVVKFQYRDFSAFNFKTVSP